MVMEQATPVDAIATPDEERKNLTPLFEATVALSGFPPVDEFVAQHRRANEAIQVEADFLFALWRPDEALTKAGIKVP